MGVDVMQLIKLGDGKVYLDISSRFVCVDDIESISGALVEITHILDTISGSLDEIEPGMGTGIFEISTMLDMEIKRIEGDAE